MSLLPPPRPPHHSRLTHLLSSAYLLSTTSPSISAHLLSQHYSQAYSRDITTTLPRGSGGQVLCGNGAGGGCKRCGLVWVLGWNCHVGVDGGVVKRSSKRRGKTKMKMEKRKSKSKSKSNSKEIGVNTEPGSGSSKKDRATGGDGPRQKWVEWTCGGCGYVAKGELGSVTRAEKPQITSTPLPPTPALIPQKSIATAAPTGIPNPPSRPQTAPMVATKAPVPAQVAALQIPAPLQPANQRAKERKKKKNNSLQEMLAAKREREAASGGGSGGKGLGGMDLMDLMKLG